MARTITIDGNEAVARIAYLMSEVMAIYPITPSSTMGEWADQWASEDRVNLWGAAPEVVEMQSEAGAAGAIHGAVLRGALATTFTASQGLLLMIPNMFKMAGELTPVVFHVAARTLATHALSIFGDHSDVMAVRTTGFALLSSGSVQEAMDLAAVSHCATLKARIPFIHFFDGFRTSHETARIQAVEAEHLRKLLPEDALAAHRGRALSPEHPVIRGTAQNPDVFFQAREACNGWYDACPAIVQQTMDEFAAATGRQYHLFDYYGAADAERVIILMGSGGDAVAETCDVLNRLGEKVGLVRVRLFRPFSAEALLNALPATVKAIAVLDRTKEPGALGEPLFQDVLTVLAEAGAASSLPFATMPRVIGGRYGLSSKEFNPAMVKAVYDELAKDQPKRRFTVGIVDDVTGLSLSVDREFNAEDPLATRAVFYGLGSDGTVSANKNTVKIVGEETGLFVQAYFVYDSKKSGSVTVSHLRFSPSPIRSSYLVERAGFVACHQFFLLDRMDVLKSAEHGATLLLNAPFPADEVWDRLPRSVQSAIIAKELRVYTIDAARVANEVGLGGRISTIMQTCFFELSALMSREEAMDHIKKAINKTWGRRGDTIVEKNLAAVDAAISNLHAVPVPSLEHLTGCPMHEMNAQAPEFVRSVLGRILTGDGDDLPVSALPADGSFPTATSQWEKRDIATRIPVWDPEVCVQCGKCVIVCPHATIRAKLVTADAVAGAPDGFLAAASRFPDHKDHVYTLQVAPEDCTGCGLCVEVCPVKNRSQASLKAINMVPQPPIMEAQRRNWEFFEQLPDFDRAALDFSRVKDTQLLEPLFEFSGACGGCGETPYLRLLTQLFGERMLVANATGCSSIYGGNLPTTPWSTNHAGHGPAWANSLFEDNAEFGLGMRVAIDQREAEAATLLKSYEPELGTELVASLLGPCATEAEIAARRAAIATLRESLITLATPTAKRLLSLSDVLMPTSLWIIGGDGWAYDIGFGGLDHVIASGRKVNILVLDTEVYSNTGGQQSKSTPRGAVAKFAAAGKRVGKKDLGLMAMTYGTVYVARIAMGANDAHTIRVLREAEAHPGPSLIIAYSHCIAHGYDLVKGCAQQKLAVDTGAWPLFRFNPSRRDAGMNPLEIDSKPPSVPLQQYLYNESRFSMLKLADPDVAKAVLVEAQAEVQSRDRLYRAIAAMPAGEAANAIARATS